MVSGPDFLRACECRPSSHIGGVANDPRVHRAIQIVLVLLFVAVFGMTALALALLRT